MYDFCDDYESMFENIIGSAYSYLATAKVKTLIIGMSGGIDSALTAALATEVVNRLKNNLIVYGIMIDIHSKREEVERGKKAAKVLCSNFAYHNLSDTFDIITEDIDSSDLLGFSNKEFNKKDLIRRGNIKARLRMIKLYDLAKDLDGIVLSTDNYTEYLLGFWTLHGDVGDFGMIQSLWKTEVYGLANYLVEKYNRERYYDMADALTEATEAMPTDGLGVTNTDFDQIYPEANKTWSPVEVYHLVDTMLYDYIINKNTEENSVVSRHKATRFKRENPFNIPRKYIVG
jgi:nicotinamide-nucleotide amidase